MRASADGFSGNLAKKIRTAFVQHKTVRITTLQAFFALSAYSVSTESYQY